MDLKWHKIPDVYPTWSATLDGEEVARAVMTGRKGVDHYPWDFYTIGDRLKMASGTSPTLRSAKDTLRYVERAS